MNPRDGRGGGSRNAVRATSMARARARVRVRVRVDSSALVAVVGGETAR